MNDPIFLEAGFGLARRMFDRSKSNSIKDAIHFGFCLSTTRAPDQKETDVLRGLYEESVRTFSENGDSAHKLLHSVRGELALGVSPLNASEVAMLAAWFQVDQRSPQPRRNHFQRMSLFDPKEGIFGQHDLSRRAALSTLGIGLGSIAMQSMLGKSKPLPEKVAPGPHFGPKPKTSFLFSLRAEFPNWNSSTASPFWSGTMAKWFRTI